MSDIPLILWLAWRDWGAEWRTSLCLAVGVAAAAAPLLILFSIRSGVLESLRGELERYPSSRELRSTGQPRVAWALIQALRARKDVAFAAPRTRLLSASGLILRADTAVAAGDAVDLAPSGPGDPLAAAAGAGPWRAGTVVLSWLAAREAGLKPGSAVRLQFERNALDGSPEKAEVSLRLSGILPAWASSQRLALIDPDLLSATEIYREDPAVADLAQALAAARRTRATRAYAGLRVYASGIDTVEALRAELARRGIETEGRLEEIRLLRRLDQALTALFVLVGAVVSFGLALSLGAAQWAWVERKRRDLSFLRLLGVEPGQLALMPAVQAVLTAGAGMALAGLTAWGADRLIDTLFAGQFAGVAQISRLRPEHVAGAAALVIVAALLASLAASRAARRVSPAVVLRGG